MSKKLIFIQEEVIFFYMKELGLWNMVYKYMGKFIITCYIFFYLVFVILGTFYFIQERFYWAVACLLGCFFILGTLNWHNKKIIKKEHKIRKQEFFWGGRSFENVRIKKLFDFVDERIDNNEKLEILINNLKNEVEYKKYNRFFISGLGLALFIPLWNNIISVFFRDADLEIVLVRFFAFLSILLVIVLVGSLIKMFVSDIFQREVSKIKELVRYLECILLERTKGKDKDIA